MKMIAENNLAWVEMQISRPSQVKIGVQVAKSREPLFFINLEFVHMTIKLFRSLMLVNYPQRRKV
jgi:hypothetical protein